MNFWTILKYALMAIFTIIILLGAYLAADDSGTPPAQSQPIVQPGQSKFNF